LVRLESLALATASWARLAGLGLTAQGILKQFGAALLGLSLIMNAHADGGRSSGQSADDKSLFETGISRFVFEGWAGPKLRVWTYVPSSAPADARILFVLHGVERDAKRYMEDWVRIAERHGVILVAPEFDERRFPGPEYYNQGGVIDPRSGRTRDTKTWTFSVIEPLFDEVRRRTGSKASAYSMYGHSAGAQFVHRFVMLAHPVRLDHAVAANAGWYTWFDPDRPFPKGMDLGRRFGPDRAAFAERLTILLGTEDIETDDRNLRDDAWTRKQGANRFERGRAFFAHAEATANSSLSAFGWQLKYAPGVAHENRKMALYAASVLFQAKDHEARTQFFLELNPAEEGRGCEPVDGGWPWRLGLTKAACGNLADVAIGVWADQDGAMEEAGSAILIDQPIGRKDTAEPPQRLPRSVRIALIDAAGKDPRESSRLEKKVEDVVDQGAHLVILLNSPTDGRIRKADRYTLFHVPRQKQSRRDRESGCRSCGRELLMAFAPEAAGRTVRVRFYPANGAGKNADTSQSDVFAGTVRRIVSRTKDKVRFEAGRDAHGDYLSFEIDWPRQS
jgi:hypothetical protein